MMPSKAGIGWNLVAVGVFPGQTDLLVMVIGARSGSDASDGCGSQPLRKGRHVSSSGTPGQSIPLESLLNLRDIGGYSTADGGRVRTGVLFRSTDTSRLADAEVPAVEELRLKTVVDLRTDLERGAAPDRALPGVREVVLDVLADSKDSAPAKLPALLSNPAAANDLLGNGKAVAMFEAGYREFVTLPSSLTGFRDFLTLVGTSDDVPVLFHCTTGKDRTGWAAASLLTALGVSQEDVYHDYLLTNEQLVPQLRPRLKPFADAGGDISLLEPVIGVRTEYLDAAFNEMTTTFGSFDNYLSTGLGIDTAGLQRLRDRLVEY